MSAWFLYGLTVLIWGSTWIAIKYQLGTVDPMASIAHRFALSALLILLFLLLQRQSLGLPLRHHPFLLLQGLCLFCGNYFFVYHAELVLASGLVSVVFAGIMMLNVLNGALFLGSPVHAGVVVGGLVGLLGMGMVFWPELKAFNLSDASFVALLYCLAGTLLASFGNIIAARNKLHDLPLLVGNVWAMGYGAAAMYIAALLAGVTISFDTSPAYVLSLLYLVIFGSVIAFWAYLTLVGNIGADRAGYANLLFPLVALAISTAIEGYQWTLVAVAGMSLVMIGNWLVMRAQGRAKV
ncbi:MAG: DMT family transporter [Halieaceae bacterium]|nr:DMT family transporter [Halieaceae bacterium]